MPIMKVTPELVDRAVRRTALDDLPDAAIAHWAADDLDAAPISTAGDFDHWRF